MIQKRIVKKGISVEFMQRKMNRMKQAFMKRNAEIRKIMEGDFKLERMLEAQWKYELRVEEFQEMISDLCMQERKRGVS